MTNNEFRAAVKEVVMQGLDTIAVCQTAAHLDMVAEHIVDQIDNIVGTLTAVRVIDAAYLSHQREWSEQAFGPGERTLGVLDHIRKELVEIEAAPWDISEWADLLILAFDGAWRSDHEPQAIIDAVAAKQARNEHRRWPDWRIADPNKAIEHIREAA